MSNIENYLSSDDIIQIFPRYLINYFIKSIAFDDKLFVGVMLDYIEDYSEFFKKSGPIYLRIGCTEYCQMLINWDENIRNMCNKHTIKQFNSIKLKALSDSHYKGELTQHCPGCLLAIGVPIIDRESDTFIGTIFAAQKRPIESNKNAKNRLKTFLQNEEYEPLRKIPFRKLYHKYLKVAQSSIEDLNKLIPKYYDIATEIASPYKYFIKAKKKEYQENVKQNALITIDEILLKVRDFENLQSSMCDILKVLKSWLNFNWGVILCRNSKESSKDKLVFELRASAGLNEGIVNRLRNTKIEFPRYLMLDQMKPIPNPPFFTERISSIFKEKSDFIWIPLLTPDYITFGAIIISTIYNHYKREYDQEEIKKQFNYLISTAYKITNVYGEVSAKEKLDINARKLASSLLRETTTNEILKNTLLSLTHQLNRPLIMIQSALSNIGNSYNSHPQNRLIEDIEIANILTYHTQLLCKGISKIFAYEQGRQKFDVNSVLINTEQEIKRLCESMKKVSGRDNIYFNYSFDPNSPEILMDRDSFLYVFYALIDNAIKYSDLGTTIKLECSEERPLRRYLLKVKSYGQPIEPNKRDKVFEKFYRGTEAASRDETGLGIGCWAALNHMRIQGGDIKLEVDGKLSVFIVSPPKTQFIKEG